MMVQDLMNFCYNYFHTYTEVILGIIRSTMTMHGKVFPLTLLSKSLGKHTYDITYILKPQQHTATEQPASYIIARHISRAHSLTKRRGFGVTTPTGDYN